MGIDTSIYQSLLNAEPQKINLPNPIESAKGAMSLSQLGMQQMAMQRQLQQQQALRDAYAKNIDPNTGKINQAGVLSQLTKSGMGYMLPEQMQSFGALNKSQAEAQSAQADAANKTQAIVGTALENVSTSPKDQQPRVWTATLQQLKDRGIDVSAIDHPFTQESYDQYMQNWKKSPAYAERQLKQAETAEKWSNVAMTPLKRQGELFGSRSPNNTLTESYSREPSVKDVRSSQVAMNQMIDNYYNPSPQGDASLKLNAFKIKFPTAPDVNSLDELSKAQGLTDQMKAWLTHNAQGTLDKNTRENLMRDAISTFRANRDSLLDTQSKYQDYARKNGIPDLNISEPSIEKTWSKAGDIQQKIGPYQTPTERGDTVLGMAKKLVGVASEPTAKADSKGTPKAAPSASDKAALEWLNNPKTDKTSPEAFGVQKKLKAKGLL